MTERTIETLLLDETFIDYCLNPASPHTEKWKTHLAAHPEDELMFEDAKQLLMLLGPQLSPEEIQQEVLRLKAQLSLREIQQVPIEPGEIYVDRNGRLGRRRVQRVLIASVLLLIVAFSIGWFITPARRAVTPTAQAISTKTGERKTYILPDGSEVILNSNSSISFEQNFSGKERRVQLTGEAFFKVAKDATRPFIVSSNDFSTTAIGTAFMVDARHPNKDYRVSLLEGRVKINGTNTSSMLAPGERVDWTGSSKTFTRSTFDTLQLKAWLAGDLRLKRIDAATAFSILEDWYAVNIIDQRRVKSDLIVSGNFSNENLNDVLKVICFSLSCQYEIKNDTVTIK